MVRINTVWIAILMRTIVTGSFADCVSKASALSMNIASYETEQVLHPDDEFAQDVEDYKAAPQNPQVLLLVDDSFFTVPTDLTIHDTLLHEMSLGKALELAKVKAMELNLKQVASDIKLWVEHHPWKAAFYAASAIGFFAPEILSISALEALGFGITGVRAGMSKLFTFEVSYANQNRGRLGSLASKIQSVIGPVAAYSVFAIWQSARMGGYGVEFVNGGVRALIALTDAAVAACNPLKDCKGLISNGGQQLLRDPSATIALTIFCGFLVALSNLLGLAW